MFETSR